MKSERSSRRVESDVPPDRRFDFERKLGQHPERVREAVKPGIGRSLSTVFLDLSAVACNHKCIFCDGRFYEAAFSTFETGRLLELASEFKMLGADSIVFVGEYSEPTLHPGFCSVARRLRELGFHRGIYTNGCIPLPETIATLADFDFVRVSLDAGCASTHQKIHQSHRTHDFERALQFIQYLSTHGNADVGVSFVLLPENVAEIALAAHTAREHGAKYIEIKPFYGPEYSFDSDTLLRIKPVLLQQLNECRNLETATFKILLNVQLQDAITSDFTQLQLTRVATPRHCLTSKLRLVVSPRGCYICPPYRGRLDKSLGDAKTTSLHDIWYGAQHAALLTGLCDRRCVYHDQNELLLRIQSGSAAIHESADSTAQAGFL